MDVTNPHDKFFKDNFTDKEIVTDFIKETFPQELLKNLDLNSLELDNNSYIDEELKEYYSDLVYDCNYRDEMVKVSILFEHKSYIPNYPFLQLLKYILKIWDYNIKQNVKITPVIPLIFYHGKEKWEYKKLYEYFEGIDDSLKRYLPNFDFLLTDLSSLSDNDIKDNIFENEMLKIVLLIMKNIFDEKKLVKSLENFLILGKLYYEEEKGLRFLESVIRYLYNNVDEIKVDEIVKVINKISVTGGERSMTIAMKLKEEGKKEAKKEDAKRMLDEGFDVKIISKITGLTVKEIEKLKK